MSKLKELNTIALSCINELENKILNSINFYEFEMQHEDLKTKLNIEFYEYFKNLKIKLNNLIFEFETLNKKPKELIKLEKIIAKYTETNNYNCYELQDKLQIELKKYNNGDEWLSKEEILIKHLFWSNYTYERHDWEKRTNIPSDTKVTIGKAIKSAKNYYYKAITKKSKTWSFLYPFI